MTEDMKPCPFCGRAPVGKRYQDLYWYECSGFMCGLSSADHRSPIGAEAEWNRLYNSVMTLRAKDRKMANEMEYENMEDYRRAKDDDASYEAEFGGEVNMQGLSADQLRSFITRIERLCEEKAAIATDIREVYAEAKSAGFDAKVMRKIVAMRKKDRHELAEEEELIGMYRAAVGV